LQIKSVKVINMKDPNGFVWGYEVGEGEITSIEDKSLQSDDGNVYSEFDVFSGEETIARIVNAPVVIEYFRQ